MTTLEWVLIAAIIIIILLVLAWFLKSSTGRVSMRRPIESRVDEYLDRRFEDLIAEHSLVRRPKVQNFREEQGEHLDKAEEKVATIQAAETTMKASLEELESRLDALENNLAGSGKKKQ